MEVRILSAEELTPAVAAELLALEDSGDPLFASVGIVFEPSAVDPQTWAADARVVLVVGEPMVGFCRIDLVDGAPYVEQLSVHPSHARRGLGRLLMNAAADWARAGGYGEIWLTTFLDIPWNGPFYRSLGYTVADPGPGLAAIRRHEIDAGIDAFGSRAALRMDLATNL